MTALLLCAVASFAAPTSASAAESTCGTIGVGFSSPAVTGSLTKTATSSCYTLSDVALGDQVVVRGVETAGSNGVWTLRDGDGRALCSDYLGTSRPPASCQLSGSAGWTVTAALYDQENGSLSYALSTRKLNGPAGCTAIANPADWSFAAARTNGTISGVLGASCFSFSRPLAGADQTAWLRTGTTSGAMSPDWILYGPSGTEECRGSAGGTGDCGLRADGTFSIMVFDRGGTASGSFYLATNRTSSPAGCTPAGSSAFGTDPLAGSLAVGSEIDCLTLPAATAGDHLTVQLKAGSSNGYWFITDDTGDRTCSGNYSQPVDCVLSGTGAWHAYIYDLSGTAALSYSFAARKTNAPAGCTALTADQLSFAGARINGSVAGALKPTCYTFVRESADADDLYWIRSVRTSGTITPNWDLYGPSGTRECSSASNSTYSPCAAQASGTYTIVVDDDNSSDAGSYFLTPKRVTNPVGCTDAPSPAFGAAPAAGSIAVAGDIDCFNVTGAAGSTVDVGLIGSQGSPSWLMLDADGSRICSGGGSLSTPCELSGAEGWKLLVYEGSGSSTFTYSLAVRNLAAPQGCTELGAPDAFSFTATRVNGSLAGALRPNCYAFERTEAEGDGSYWIQTVRTSGTIDPVWRVYDETGALACNGNEGPYSRACNLRASGKLILVVDDGDRSRQGAYYLTAKRLTAPRGCADVPSVAFGVPETPGRLLVSGETDCFAFPAASDDAFTFTFDGTGFANQLSVVDASGEVVCRTSSTTSCVARGESPYHVLVDSSSGSGTGTYRFSATCDNVPCGQTDTALVDASPNQVGGGSKASISLRGRDLDLMKSVVFKKGADAVTGVVGAVSADRRSRSVLFDTATAASGAWNIEATFLDGTVRTLTGGVSVVGQKPAAIKVSIIGRDVYRIGTPSTVTIQVSNTGNVDGLGAPVTLTGIPAGSTVTPQFELTEFRGPADASTVASVPFDPAVNMAAAPDGTLVVPFIVGRVPAESSIQLKIDITIPAGVDYSLRASGGACATDTADAVNSAGVTGSSVTPLASKYANSCVANLTSLAANVALSAVPFSGCAGLAADVGIAALEAHANSETIVSPSNLIGWTIGGVSCATDFFPPAKIVKIAGTTVGSIAKYASAAGFGFGSGQAAGNCLAAGADALLSQRGVASFDPNDMIGPAGAGDEHYISGDGEQLYQVLFENLPSASASAQLVTLTNQLDLTKFDPATVRFRSVQFGTTVVPLAGAGATIDQTVDLRPANNLLVKVKGSVSESGLISWELRGIDPDTLAAPSDPLAGFLPPNKVAPEGDGSVSYSVQLKDLAPKTVVTNSASVVFDTNAPILTPVWSNTIDKEAPTVSLSAEQDPSGSDKAKVTWGGTDDASGVVRWDIRVTSGGGEAVLWHTAETAGSETYTAKGSGTYSFKATAFDGAGNSIQSAQAAVTLAAGGTGPPVVQPTTPPAVATTPPAVVVTTPPAVTPPVVTPPAPTPPVSPPSANKAPADGAPAISLGKLSGLRAGKKGQFVLPTTIACQGAGPACAFSIKLTMPGKKKGKSKKAPKATPAGSVAGSLATGAASTGPVIKLNKTALKALKKSKKLKVTVAISVTRGAVRTEKTVVVTLKP